MIWPGVTYPTDTRLYEIPQDIAPLVMSSVVYSAELDEASPTNKEKATPPVFTFEKMLQATLLDLMDRGVIVYEQQGNEVVLTRKSHGHVDDFERSFMNMAFGDQVSCPVNRLFENYKFSDDVYKHAKKADQDAIRSLGSWAQGRFDTAVNQVARDVHRKVEDLHLPSYYRPLEAKKKRKLDEVSSLVGLLGLSPFWSRNLCYLWDGLVLCSLFDRDPHTLVYASALQWCL